MAQSNLPNDAQWRALKTVAQENLETLLNEMQGYFDDRSERWQESKKAFEFQCKLDDLEGVISDLVDLVI